MLITLGIDDVRFRKPTAVELSIHQLQEGGDGTLKFWDLSQWDDEGIPDLFQELLVGATYLV